MLSSPRLPREPPPTARDRSPSSSPIPLLIGGAIRRRRRLQRRLHRARDRVPAGAGPARTPLPGAGRDRGHRRLHRRRARPRTSAARSTRSASSRTSPASTRSQVSDDGETALRGRRYDAPADDLDAAPRERLEAADGAALAASTSAFAGEVIDGAATGGFPIGEVAGLRDRDRPAHRGAAQPPRRGQRAARRLRRRRRSASASCCGPRRSPRCPGSRRRWPGCSASAPGSTTRSCSPHASRRSCARVIRRARPRGAPTPPPATRR